MLPNVAILAAVITSHVVAEGFIHFEVEKTSSIQSASRLQKRADGSIYSQVAQNLANHQEYIVNLNIGTPQQQLGVTLDTGSSNLWVPSASFCRAQRCDFGSFNPAKSSSQKLVQQGTFNISYASPGDSDAGDWVSDSVSIGNSSAVQNQIFGLSNSGLDRHGVLGIGLGKQITFASNGSASYPTLVENLAQNGLINRQAYSLHLNSYNQKYGSLVFGGVDSTKYTGDLIALPLQPGPGSKTVSGFYVTLSQVTFTDATGSNSVLTPEDYAQSVLLDSGTSYTALTNEVIERLANGLGAVAIDDVGGLVVPCRYNSTNATINYTFGGSGGVTISVPFSEVVGTSNQNQCNLGLSSSLIGLSVLGDTFLRSAYAVFDIDNQIVALAQAVNGQAATSNVTIIPTGASIPGVKSTAFATGTQLGAVAASVSPIFVTASRVHNSILTGTPTFNLGSGTSSESSSSSSTSSSSNMAVAPAATGLSQFALLGAGLVVGAIVL